MEDLTIRIEEQVDELIRLKETRDRENTVLRRENERLRNTLSELTLERDTLAGRVKLSASHVENALTRLKHMTEEF